MLVMAILNVLSGRGLRIGRQREEDLRIKQLQAEEQSWFSLRDCVYTLHMEEDDDGGDADVAAAEEEEKKRPEPEKKDSSSKVTLSGLLNFIDGFWSSSLTTWGSLILRGSRDEGGSKPGGGESPDEAEEDEVDDDGIEMQMWRPTMMLLLPQLSSRTGFFLPICSSQTATQVVSALYAVNGDATLLAKTRSVSI